MFILRFHMTSGKFHLEVSQELHFDIAPLDWRFSVGCAMIYENLPGRPVVKGRVHAAVVAELNTFDRCMSMLSAGVR